jgi:2-dehydropantoate 2-reductase
MNICVYGAGAVGGSIAARLFASGESVSVIARGAHAEAIRQRGLTVLAGGSRIEAQVRCAGDPAELGPQDLVVVTVKGQQLPAIARPLGRMLESGAHAVFAMNGILWWFADGLPLRLPPAFADSLDPGGELRRCIPPDRIIGAVVNSSNEVIEPGVILNTSPQRNRLVIGAAHDASTEAVTHIAALFARAGYDAPVTPNIRQELWNKLGLYLGVSPVAALTHCALDRLVGDSAAYAMMAGLMREAIAIGDRLGFAHPGDVDSQLGFFRDKPTRPSMLQDFELGREPELAGSILAVEAIAQAMDIRAPRIDLVATLLRLKAASIGPTG